MFNGITMEPLCPHEPQSFMRNDIAVIPKQKARVYVIFFFLLFWPPLSIHGSQIRDQIRAAASSTYAAAAAALDPLTPWHWAGDRTRDLELQRCCRSCCTTAGTPQSYLQWRKKPECTLLVFTKHLHSPHYTYASWEYCSVGVSLLLYR